MKKKNDSFGLMQKARPYDGIILRLQKDRSWQAVLTVFTRQAGLMRFVSAKGKRSYRQGFGSLLSFSEMTFDAWQHGDVHILGEYESKRSNLLDALTWDQYIYTQLFTEIVLFLEPAGVADERAFLLLQSYSRSLGQRNVRIATIIAGWQLVACAGYQPDPEMAFVYQGSDWEGRPSYYVADEAEPERTEVPVSPEVRQLWRQFFTYTWKEEDHLQVNKTALSFLERLLCCYVEQLAGRPLKTAKLIDV